MNVETMIAHYVIALLWSETDDDQQPLDGRATPDDLSPEALDSIRDDCQQFAMLAADDLLDMDPAQAGHDFLLTRNHHGAGFWDRGLGERGERLTAFAHSFGETSAYVGNDGTVGVE